MLPCSCYKMLQTLHVTQLIAARVERSYMFRDKFRRVNDLRYYPDHLSSRIYQKKL